MINKNRKKWTIEYCRMIAGRHHGECLSEKYINNKAKLNWKCKDGFVWSANLNSILLGHWCPHCVGLAKFCIEDCNNFAKNKNGKCISTSYINAKRKLEWECEFGHRWMAAAGNIFGGQWCPKCCKNYKLNINICAEYAKECGGLCLSKKYVNSKNNLQWQCQLGHRWFAAPGGMIRDKYWCRKCAGTYPVGIDLCKKYAKSIGGECISDVYINSMTKLEWRCEVGHVWNTAPTNVLNKQHWCPFCKNKSENKILDILKQIFPNNNIIAHFRGFAWLKNKNKMEIDFWLPELKLAIEYDGKQHFMPVEFGGNVDAAQKEFGLVKQRDTIKNELINQHQNEIKYFIRIPYTVQLTRENLNKLMGELNVIKP